jgi:PAS domain S-box-containing protein
VVRRSIPLLRSYAWLLVLGIGSTVSFLAYRFATDAEWRRKEAEFYRRADVHHTIAREVLNYYDAGLFGLRNLFLADRLPSRAEFERATREIIGRYPGIASIEWAPVVSDAERGTFEQKLSAELGRPVRIMKTTDGGTRLEPVETKASYTPVTYIEPALDKEIVFGFDITTGLIAPTVERAGREHALIVSPTVKLIEKPDRGRLGFVWIWPIYRDTAPAPAGYVLGVFRVSDMLDEVLRRQPTHALEILYLDPTPIDPNQHAFYYQNSAVAPGPKWPSEEEFRRSALFREQTILIGGKTWTLLYRPTLAWFAENRTRLPLWLLGAGLFGSAALASWVWQLGRRTTIIERLVAERTDEVIESRRELASFLHALPGMAFRGRYDERFTLFYVSEGSLALTGYSPEDFLAGRIHLRDLIAPEDLAGVRAATRAAIDSGRSLEIEYRLRPREGREKWVLARGHGRHSEKEDFSYFEGLAIDITAQKNAEAERLGLERKLLEGQKLESLGLLAGGVAHDFNNLLTGVLGNANLARLHLPGGSAADPHLQAIETASLRAAELCRQMLAYAGKGRFVVEPVDLNALAEGLVPLLKISIGHRAELRLELGAGLPSVMADATQLRQIVMNFVLNAADATSGRPGPITIASGIVHAHARMLARCAAGADCFPGDYVFIEVRDHGIGMTPEVRAKIFDPFFTTKFAGRGLGLAAALGIIRSHQGALLVESEPGVGSTFRVLLPPSSSTGSRPAANGAPPAVTWRHAGRALVIDDEEPVRLVAAEMLASFGLSPSVAAGGEAGLAIFREDPAAIDVVVLDFLMPGMNGEQTLAALRAIRPDVRVLLVSGYAEGDFLRRLGPEHGRLAFLAKPFTRESFANNLRDLFA